MKAARHTTHSTVMESGDQWILGKPVIMSDTRILNLHSGFQDKLLCDGPTFSPGVGCAYRCSYCYTGAVVGRKPFVTSLLRGHSFQDVVIRRQDPVNRLRNELRNAKNEPRFKGDLDQATQGSGEPIVCYGSPLVDIAATDELATETSEMVQVLLAETNWQIRLLSKSPLIKTIALSLKDEQRARVIFGLSTGSLDDDVAGAIEPTCPSPSKRIEALRWLQNNGYRTFGMLCPILPQESLEQYADNAVEAIRPERCEGVWAEVLNARGNSMAYTISALEARHLHVAADRLKALCGHGNRSAWEAYARETFLALVRVIPRGANGPRLHFMQYVTNETVPWWREREKDGVVILGRPKHKEQTCILGQCASGPTLSVAHEPPIGSELSAVSMVLAEANSLVKAVASFAQSMEKAAARLAV